MIMFRVVFVIELRDKQSNKCSILFSPLDFLEFSPGFSSYLVWSEFRNLVNNVNAWGHTSKTKYEFSVLLKKKHRTKKAGPFSTRAGDAELQRINSFWPDFVIIFPSINEIAFSGREKDKLSYHVISENLFYNSDPKFQI